MMRTSAFTLRELENAECSDGILILLTLKVTIRTLAFTLRELGLGHLEQEGDMVGTSTLEASLRLAFETRLQGSGQTQRNQGGAAIQERDDGSSGMVKSDLFLIRI